MRLLKLITLWPPFQEASEESGEPPDVPGIEYVWRGDRLHHTWNGARLHYVWRGDRLHYSQGEEL